MNPPRVSRQWPARSARSVGFTLIEVLVVIVVMVVAAGVVAPAFIPSKRADPSSDLARLVRAARVSAAARGETLFVRLAADGAWRIEGATSADAGDVASGTLRGYEGPSATLIVSPLGTCAFDVRSTAGAAALSLDPMTCEILEP